LSLEAQKWSGACGITGVVATRVPMKWARNLICTDPCVISKEASWIAFSFWEGRAMDIAVESTRNDV